MASTALRVERKPKLSESVVATIRKQLQAGEIQPGQKLPTEGQLTETFGVSRTVIREAHGQAGRRKGWSRRARAPGCSSSSTSRPHSAPSLPRWATGSRSRSMCSRCGWRSRSRSAGLAAIRRNAAQEAAIQEAFFEFERLLLNSEPTGGADLAFHRAIAAPPTTRSTSRCSTCSASAPSPATSPRPGRPSSCNPTNTSADCSASTWSSSTPFRQVTPKPRATRCACICRPASSAIASVSRRDSLLQRQLRHGPRQGAGGLTAAIGKDIMSSTHTDYTSRYAIDPAAAAAMGTDELRHHFHIAGLFEPGRIKLTYTHYDRMIVGGATPVDAPLVLRSDQADRHQGFPRSPRTDRRQHRRRRQGRCRWAELRDRQPRHDLSRHGHQRL